MKTLPAAPGVPVPPFNVGDWVFCEFKLQIVKEVRQGHVSEVSDGMFAHCGWNLDDRCFPLTMRIKRISDEFEEWHSKLHREGNRNLNYPDILRWLVDKWCECCNDEQNDATIRRCFDELNAYGNELLAACGSLNAVSVGGHKVFR